MDHFPIYLTLFTERMYHPSPSIVYRDKVAYVFKESFLIYSTIISFHFKKLLQMQQ